MYICCGIASQRGRRFYTLYFQAFCNTTVNYMYCVSFDIQLARSLYFKSFDSADSFAASSLWQFWNITFGLLTLGNTSLASFDVLTLCFGCVSRSLGSLCSDDVEIWTSHFDEKLDSRHWIPRLLSPEIPTLENCKRSKWPFWRFYQPKVCQEILELYN